jgi:HYR domain/Secretion system C-terminal sorting domain
MKSIFTILLMALFLCPFSNLYAQHIPDVNFADAIRNQCPTCIDGNNDLTADAATLTTLSLFNRDPAPDLTGIEGFTGLLTLNIEDCHLTNLPPLPAGLKELNCSGNLLTSLPDLPPGLERLNCNVNLLTSLPSLPTGLIYLNIAINNISSLPSLPGTLKIFYSYLNPIHCLPTLPASLSLLSLDPASITCLPNEVQDLNVVTFDGGSPVTLPVCGLTITNSPSSISQCVGSAATLTAVATGTGTITVQWQKKSTGDPDFTDVGATSAYTAGADANYNLPALTLADNGALYRAKFTGSCLEPVVTLESGITVTNCCTMSCPADITVNNTLYKCETKVNYPAFTSSPANCGGAVTYSKPSGSWFPVGVTTVTVTTTGGATCSFKVTVKDVQKPTIVCPSDITVTATSNSCSKVVNFNLTVADNCPGVTVTTSPASGSVFNVGTTTVTATATDASGNKTTSTFKVKVKESQPPVIKVAATPIVLLWPANGSYQKINLSQFVVSVTDNCSTIPVSNVKITKVTSDEPDNASGDADGNTTKDMKIASDCKSVDLRRERNSKGNGRVYTIYVSVTDASGNTGNASFKVIAPISQNGTTATDNGSASTVSSYCSGNSYRPGATTTEDEEVIVKNEIPEGFILDQNYPNPFSAVTTIRYAIQVKSKVSLGVYNQLGQRVAQLVEGTKRAGYHQESFDATKLSAGIYLYRLLAVDAEGKPVLITKKMIVAK